MDDIAYGQLLGTKTTEAKVYQLMEASMIVAEEFGTLLRDEKINEDYIYGESESNTYDTLIGITLDIEKQNTDENPIYIEDIREMAEEMILKAYPKKKKYAVTREYFKQVVVEADSIEEAKTMASSQYLFDNATLEPGDTTAEQVE